MANGPNIFQMLLVLSLTKTRGILTYFMFGSTIHDNYAKSNVLQVSVPLSVCLFVPYISNADAVMINYQCCDVASIRFFYSDGGPRADTFDYIQSHAHRLVVNFAGKDKSYKKTVIFAMFFSCNEQRSRKIFLARNAAYSCSK